MSRLDRREMNCDALAFSLSRAKIAPDDEYRTQIKRRPVSSLVCFKASFKAYIRSASDFCWLAFRENKIRHPRCSFLVVAFDCFPIDLRVP